MLELWKASPRKRVSDSAPPKSKYHRLVSPQAFLRLAILVALFPILGLFGRFHWILDLFSLSTRFLPQRSLLLPSEGILWQTATDTVIRLRG
jgi:hypothetical protein